MGRPTFNWRKIVRQIFHPRNGRGCSETTAPSPSTPVKADTKSLRPSKSFSIFRNLSTPSSEIRDDTSSFMSPVPEEFKSLPSEDSDIFMPLPDESDDLGGLSGLGETDSIRLSFIHCDKIIDTFPDPPRTYRSQTLPSRRFVPTHRRFPSEFSQLSSEDLVSPRYTRSSTQHKLSQVHGRAPTRRSRSVRHGSLQHSTTPIPFDLLSGNPAVDGFMHNPILQRDPSCTSLVSSASLRLQLSPVSSRSSSQSSLTRSRSCNLLLRPVTPEASFAASNSTTLSLRRRPSSRDARPISPTLSPLKATPLSPLSSSSALPLESFHVPGLEHRRVGSSSSSFITRNGLPNTSGSPVPFGTLRF